MLHRNRLTTVAVLVLAHAARTGSAAAADETTTKTEVKEVQAGSTRDEPTTSELYGPGKRPPARFGVSVNPIGLLFGLFIGEFDYGLSDRMSLNINGTYWNTSLLGFKTTAVGAGAGVQYFPMEVAKSGPLYQGFFVYPSLQFLSVSVGADGISDASYVAVAPEAIVGWQWDWRPLSVRVGAGAAYYIGSVQSGYETNVDGFRFILDGSVGLTFGG